MSEFMGDKLWKTRDHRNYLNLSTTIHQLFTWFPRQK